MFKSQLIDDFKLILYSEGVKYLDLYGCSEAEGRTWYYSTPTQLEELMLALDNERWEVDLVSDLNAIKSVIVGQMTITEELTNKVKGKRNSALAAHDGKSLLLICCRFTLSHASACNLFTLKFRKIYIYI